ncbi:uncharacterized protein F4822DRAFT_424925 [Hypoxylon trugodes]|uniref:uncharacterized protein n=1 Tax=Hypoxylon trugodes TaxID=326681 RepID=UPI002192793E|nr:uncharacterized protein F4822DRAFT_424925 [Hypoxylon trugodes]KAI1394448.1 hypothetical protein F4822DRAFT_424925 [Hypoxylon trugodes]
MAPIVSKPKVYRLRGCPDNLNKRGLAELLSLAFGDVTPTDIQIQSLATSLDPWTRPPTKVGTLMFHRLPVLIEAHIDNNEWKIPTNGPEKSLLLDSHFLGMTPLNDVEKGEHEIDCIAISGLASHPFGSWQPKREDKSFMWIRDELPRALPTTRAIVYGYDTTLAKSNSFQSILDLAITFIDHIKASGLARPSAKPLIFMAHSLGGIVVKEAFAVLAGSHEQGQHILKLFRGGIFFGVPSQGMATPHLLAMVKDQVNQQLVQDLSEGSKYLRELDDQFSGLTLMRNMSIHWAYETKTSPTMNRKPDGSFSRAGPEEVLVSKASATRSLYSSRSSAIFPINENHSEMVKFREGDPYFRIVVSRLKECCRGSNNAAIKASTTTFQSKEIVGGATQVRYTEASEKVTHKDADWDPEDLKKLKIPDQDTRLETIDNNSEHTFEWIFDRKKTPLPTWLEEGTGFFWIHGKPGSGNRHS